MGDVAGILTGRDPALPEAPEPLSDEELEASVRLQYEDAASFVDSEVSPLREKAVNYYNARPYGDEEDGRSKVITQDVKDTILAILPSLLEIFFSSERAVEFVPRTPDRAAEAAQATDYVNYVVCEENRGFSEFHAWFKDALKLKTGVMKVWADDRKEIVSEIYEGLDEMQRAMLHMDPEVRVDAERAYLDQHAQPAPADPAWAAAGLTPPQPAPPLQPATLYDVRVSRTVTSKRFRMECLPPEEFLISRNAVNVEEAAFCAHRTALPASDLVAMGYSQELVSECGYSDSLAMNTERIARQPWLTVAPEGLGATPDRSMRLIDYAECYVRTDFDGDGIAELRKVCLMGNGRKMVMNKPWDEAPFATLCPDPEPHVFYGGSIADQTMDIQRIKSQILRLLLDSLAQAIRPRTWAVEGQVNQDDLLSNDVGAVVRVRAPGMMGDLSTPFVGQAAFPVLEYMDQLRENRTGITKASQGLDPDALQSSTQAAVAATLAATQQHIGMIARIFAETGVSRLFKILLRLITTHQDKKKTVKLRNQWVEVNPSEWDKTMDVAVDTALGTGQKKDKLDALEGIVGKQEQILRNFGPQNPIVSMSQYSATLRRTVELAGLRNSGEFFNQVPPNWQPPPPAPPPQDPRAQAAMILAQAQAQQTQADIVKKQGELQLSREKMFMDDATRRYQIEADYQARLAQTQAQYGMQTQQIAAKIEQQNSQIASQEKIASQQMVADHFGAGAQMAHERSQQAADAAMQQSQQEHEQQMQQSQQEHEADQNTQQQQSDQQMASQQDSGESDDAGTAD